ncbi:MAG: hypothetical protein R3321_07485 [Nitrososphaeraceae archaeon]|nr:hypothetical protein [Nitrososphaeraceae archaeon]
MFNKKYFIEFKKIKGANKVSTLTDKLVESIIKVDKENYVPNGTTVRNRISPVLFTGLIQVDKFAELDKDPLVLSILIGRVVDN